MFFWSCFCSCNRPCGPDCEAKLPLILLSEIPGPPLVRQTRGWRALATHAESKRILYWWLHDLVTVGHAPAVDAEEIIHLSGAAFGSDVEVWLWRVANIHWNSILLAPLSARLRDGHVDADLRKEAVLCLAKHASGHFAEIANQLLAENRSARLFVLLDDLSQSCHENDESELFAQIIEKWMALIPVPLQSAAEVFSLPAASRKWKVPAETAMHLCSMQTSFMAERVIKICFGQANDFDVDLEIKDVLFKDEKQEENDAIVAIRAAVKLGRKAIVSRALTHRYSRVTAEALRFAAEQISDVLPPDIRAFAGSRSRFVREYVH